MYVFGNHEVFRKTSFRKLLYVTCETIAVAWNGLKLSKYYEIIHVERMNMYNMYKQLCILYNDHHLMHCAFCYGKSWLWRHRENRWQIVYIACTCLTLSTYTIVLSVTNHIVTYNIKLLDTSMCFSKWSICRLANICFVMEHATQNCILNR